MPEADPTRAASEALRREAKLKAIAEGAPASKPEPKPEPAPAPEPQPEPE